MARGMHPALAIVISAAGGALIGALMGGISAYAKVPSFIVTLAGLVTVRGVTYLMSDGTPVGNVPKAFGAFGTAELPLFPGSTELFPVLGLIFVLVSAIGAVILRFTVFGEYVYATGGNAEAARLSGVPARSIVTAAFAISGFLASLSACY